MVVLTSKSKLLKFFEDGEGIWDHVAIMKVMTEEGRTSSYWLSNARFWLIELEANGLLETIEMKIDDEAELRKGQLLHKYKITEYGLSRVESMMRD